MQTRDDGQSRNYCLASTCRPQSELTCQLIWAQFYTNKWAALRKDPAVTPPEAADPNLLFFHAVAIFFRDRVQPRPLQVPSASCVVRGSPLPPSGVGALRRCAWKASRWRRAYRHVGYAWARQEPDEARERSHAPRSRFLSYQERGSLRQAAARLARSLGCCELSFFRCADRTRTGHLTVAASCHIPNARDVD